MRKVNKVIKLRKVIEAHPNYLNYFSYLVFFFIISCANQVPPSGGPKDVKPPKVLKSNPENYSVRFSSHEIIITFDEYVQLKDLSKQLIISPPLEKTPDVTIHKKSIIIRIKEELKPNTTYTMNFGQAIADNNEGNVLDNFQYVFSTGEMIDSLSVSGKVMNAFDHKTEKGILVMLYKTNDDSVPIKSRPDYFNRTGDSGEFKITNIAEGDYKIFALKESNSNYLFDSHDESVAFLRQPVTAGKGDKIKLQLFREKDKQCLTGKVSEKPGKVVLTFNLPVKALSIIPGNDSSKIAFTEFSAKQDTVTLWYLNRDLDSLNLFVGDEQMKTDTLTIRLFKKSSKSMKGKIIQSTLNINSNVYDEGLIDLNQDLFITLSHPLKEADLKQIAFSEDSMPAKDFSMQFLDSAKRKLSISKKWKEKASYRIYIPPGAFKDLFDQENDTFQLKFKAKSVTDYGTVALKLSLPQSDRHYLLQLIDDKENVIRQVNATRDTTFHFEYMQPGKYHLKLIDDANNNGEWDTGNYIQHLQPEETMYYGGEVNVRANWDVETTWDLK